MSNFIDEGLNQYTEQHTTKEPEVLAELSRETQAKFSKPQMLSGHLQGQFLKNLVAMKAPKKALEVGTYTGYSAIAMGYGLPEQGHLETIDVNDELKSTVHHYIQKAGLENKITTYFQNAVELIPQLDGPYELVFIDADKENYSRYFDLVIDKMAQGGIILADNVLWKGKVIQDDDDAATTALRQFNKKVHEDPRVENVMLPVRDGVMLCRKL